MGSVYSSNIALPLIIINSNLFAILLFLWLFIYVAQRLEFVSLWSIFLLDFHYAGYISMSYAAIHMICILSLSLYPFVDH